MNELVWSYSISDLKNTAEKLIRLAAEKNKWNFYGNMGVGKTTLIKEICNCWGYKGVVSSPTFGLVNEYIQDNLIIYHFDFYRINSSQEALEIGIYEYWDSGHICLMEWPEKLENLLIGEDFFNIYIGFENEKQRKIVAQAETNK